MSPRNLFYPLLFLGYNLFSITSNCHAEEAYGISISYGEARHDINSHQLGIVKSLDKRWLTEGDWYASAQVELTIGGWNNNEDVEEFTAIGERDNLIITLLPLIRFQPYTPYFGSIYPFAEIGIGISFLEKTRLRSEGSNPVDLGSHLQFADVIGFGFRWGSVRQYEVAYRFHHYSNANLGSSNDGIDFNQLELTYWF